MTPTPARTERGFLSVPHSTRQARAFVSDEIGRQGATPTVLGKLDLIVSELMANSIQYGDGGDINVSVDTTSLSWFAVTVSNGLDGRRPPMDPTTWTVTGTDQPSGRGLGIVAQLADEVALEERSGQLRVTCRLRR